VEEANKKNDEKIKELDDKIEDAVKNLGETEVRESHLAKANYLLSIGDKSGAESAYTLTQTKTVALGQSVDIILTLIRMGFFYNDHALIKRNLEKGTQMASKGDWDRRNRLKVYQAYYSMSIRDFKTASSLFVSTLPSFTATELFDFKQHVYYTVLTSILQFDRVSFKNQVVDSPEILTVLSSLPTLENLTHSFYSCDYKSFFSALASVTDDMKELEPLAPHAQFFCT